VITTVSDEIEAQ